MTNDLRSLARVLACEHTCDDWHMFGIERTDAEVDAATLSILNQLEENRKWEAING